MCINLAKYLFRDILLDSRQIKESNIESGELELGRRGEKVIFHFFLFKIVSQWNLIFVYNTVVLRWKGRFTQAKSQKLLMVFVIN